jgi:uncharacterized membrane protein
MQTASHPTITDVARIPEGDGSTWPDRVLQAGAALGLIVSGVLLVRYWPDLPELVPMHFDLSGAPDAWRGKRWLFSLPLVSLVLHAGMTVLERFPQRFDYPWRITSENAGRQYAIARRMVAALKTTIVWVFTAGLWLTCETAVGRLDGLSPWFLPVTLGSILGVLGWFLLQGARAR